MRILLTGVTGFIGSHLARRLAARHEVAALLRPGAKRERIQPLKLKELAWDESAAGLAPLLGAFKPELIIHLASLFIGEHKPGDVEGLVASNVRFPTLLLEAATAAGCRQFINTGSAWQHYDNAAYAPVSLYAATKQAFADILAYYVQVGSVTRALTLELSDTYGPDDPRPKLIPIMRTSAAEGKTMSMSPGDQLVDFVHVEDAGAAYERAIELLPEIPERQSRVYAVRSGAPLKLKDFIALYNEISPKPVKVEWGARPYRARETMQPWTQGQTLPGWQPRINLREGLKALVV